MSVRALVSLKREALPAVGRDRVRLLEAVAREGSISAGARAAGITYRAAWDALEAMANVFSAPLVETRVGGREKGGARLTESGRRVIAAFHRLEAEMARLTRDIDNELAGAGVSSRELATGFFFKTSARNALRGVVTAIKADPLASNVEILLAPEATLTAQITNRSVADLGLHVGRDVLALIKAPFVAVTTPDVAPEAGNRLRGVLRRLEISGDRAEAIVDLGDGKTLAALIAADAARSAGLVEGSPAVASFDPAHVILAID